MDVMAGDPCLIVWDVHVRPDCQRKGLGRHLLTLLELVARREGMARVCVLVMVGHEAATAWLEKGARG
jgi:ribosomal protein S18 acetylase RimI-like enzyme